MMPCYKDETFTVEKNESGQLVVKLTENPGLLVAISATPKSMRVTSPRHTEADKGGLTVSY